MKKKRIIILVCLVGVLALGFGIYQSGATSSEPELSKEAIESLVREQYPGTITELELEKNEDRAVYKVGIESKGNNYAVTLDGETGDVLNLKITEIASEQVEEDESHHDTNESEQEEGDNQEQSSSNAMLGKEAAIEIALREFSGTVVDFELDDEDGRKIYEIEIEDGEDEATIEIDAYTGEVLVLDIDIDD